MRIVQTIDELKPFQQGVLVPTMGALHEGHLALIRRAREIAQMSRGGAGAGSTLSVATELRTDAVRLASTDTPACTPPAVVVSIFINPTQFNDPNDLERYPRDFEGDCAKARSAGADVIFAPAADTVYPPDQVIAAPALPDVATAPGLEDRFRPGHFEGVCQVVARLFDLVRPRWAIFGEKDYQQLKVVEAMVRRETEQGLRWPNLEIIAHETIREPDGLAKSSRNALLPPESHDSALGLFRALEAAREFASPGRDARRMEEIMRAVLVRHQVQLDYAVVRDAQTLMPIDLIPPHRGGRALIAGWVAGIRLIDNATL